MVVVVICHLRLLRYRATAWTEIGLHEVSNYPSTKCIEIVLIDFWQSALFAAFYFRHLTVRINHRNSVELSKQADYAF